MSAHAAPMAAAPVQYSYAGQGAVPMEPVAGQPMYQSMAAGHVMQAGGQVTYGTPQVVGGQSVTYIQQGAPQESHTVTYQTAGASSIMQAGGQVTYGAPQAVAGQAVTYLQQEGQQYAAAPPVYVQAAQPYPQEQRDMQTVTYAAPQTIAQPMAQAYTQVGGQTAYSLPTSSFIGQAGAYPGMPTMAPQSYYFPQSVQQAWDNHFDAFAKQDLEQIMRDYDETSVVRVFSTDTNQLATFSGTMQIRSWFDTTFRSLSDLSGLDAPVAHVEEEHKCVYLIWKCPTSGVSLASDTFIFGHDNKIKRQNVTIYKKEGFVAQPASANAAAAMGVAAGVAGAASAGGAAAAASSAKASSSKASKKKDSSSKKAKGSKKKAKSGFC